MGKVAAILMLIFFLLLGNGKCKNSEQDVQIKPKIFSAENQNLSVYSVGRKRDTSTIVAHNGNEDSYYIKLAFIIDNSMSKKLNDNVVTINKRYKDTVHIANELFRAFNMFVALVHLEIWTEHDQTTYAKFRDYAENLTNREMKVVQLISNKNFNDTYQYVTQPFSNTFGKICHNSAYGVIFDDSNDIAPIALRLVNNLMHYMGVYQHRIVCPSFLDECEEITRARDCISFLKWTYCGAQALTVSRSQEKENWKCLKKLPDTKLYDGPVCGNRFIEPEEECDCGLSDYCDVPSCDPNTCKKSIWKGYSVLLKFIFPAVAIAYVFLIIIKKLNNFCEKRQETPV